MEKQQFSSLWRNPFAEAFQEFDETQFFQTLEDKVKPQSYYQKYKGFKNVILTLSYLFNIVSALTASYLVFWFTQWLTGMTWVAYVLSAVFLFFLEQLKRKSSSEFFQVWYFYRRIAAGWLGLSLSIFAISVACTYFGTYQGTQDAAPIATTLSPDASEESIKEEIAKLEAENATYEKQKNKEGIIYFPIQRSIERNKAMIADLRIRLTGKEVEREMTNKGLEEVHESNIKLTATTLAWITVLFEFLFECCIAYIWYYFYRSYIERKILGYSSPSPPTKNAYDHLFIQDETGTNNSLSNGTHSSPSLEAEQENGSPIATSSLPIGFFTDYQRDKQRKNLFKQNIQPFKHDLSQSSVIFQDKFTVPHKDFKTGKTRHVNMGNIENMISIYTGRVEEAKRENNPHSLKNRLEKLNYWIGKRNELHQKYTSVR